MKDRGQALVREQGPTAAQLKEELQVLLKWSPTPAISWQISQSDPFWSSPAKRSASHARTLRTCWTSLEGTTASTAVGMRRLSEGGGPFTAAAAELLQEVLRASRLLVQGMMSPEGSLNSISCSVRRPAWWKNTSQSEDTHCRGSQLHTKCEDSGEAFGDLHKPRRLMKYSRTVPQPYTFIFSYTSQQLQTSKSRAVCVKHPRCTWRSRPASASFGRLLRSSRIHSLPRALSHCHATAMLCIEKDL